MPIHLDINCESHGSASLGHHLFFIPCGLQIRTGRGVPACIQERSSGHRPPSRARWQLEISSFGALCALAIRMELLVTCRTARRRRRFLDRKNPVQAHAPAEGCPPHTLGVGVDNRTTMSYTSAMHVVVELPGFVTAVRAAGLSDDDRARIIDRVAARPDLGRSDPRHGRCPQSALHRTR
jgi:hypothetical protein